MVYYNLEKSTTKLINFVFPSFWLQFRFLCSSFSSIFDFRFSLIRYQKEERTKMHQSQLSRSADKAWVKGRKLQQGPHLNDPEQAKRKLLTLIRQQTKKTLAPRETWTFHLAPINSLKWSRVGNQKLPFAKTWLVEVGVMIWNNFRINMLMYEHDIEWF